MSAKAKTVFCSGVIACLLAAVAGAQTNQAAGGVDQLKKNAMAYEQAGDRLAAAEVYEQIVAKDPTTRRVLAKRLAAIYAECAVTNKALDWAREVIKDHPDPQPYMAGIYSLLGDFGTAERILQDRMAAVGPEKAAGGSRQALTLRWALADVYEKKGDKAAAQRELEAAAEMSKGTPDEGPAMRRMERFKAAKTDQGSGKKEEETGKTGGAQK